MLSDYEREQLAMIEQNLYADKDWSPMSAMQPDVTRRARAVVIMLIAAIVGIGVLIVGVATDTAVVGVAGFVIMLAGGVVGLRRYSPDSLPWD